jgi:hypothetical protein
MDSTGNGARWNLVQIKFWMHYRLISLLCTELGCGLRQDRLLALARTWMLPTLQSIRFSHNINMHIIRNESLSKGDVCWNIGFNKIKDTMVKHNRRILRTKTHSTTDPSITIRTNKCKFRVINSRPKKLALHFPP